MNSKTWDNLRARDQVTGRALTMTLAGELGHCETDTSLMA